MERFVPVSKMTKKQRKEYYSSLRRTWNGISPVTRTVPNGKAYNRKKQRSEDFRDGRSTRYDRDDLPLCI